MRQERKEKEGKRTGYEGVSTNREGELRTNGEGRAGRHRELGPCMDGLLFPLVPLWWLWTIFVLRCWICFKLFQKYLPIIMLQNLHFLIFKWSFKYCAF